MDIPCCLFSLLSSVRLFLIQINTEGRFESSLGSTTERRMNGYPVIVNRLIDNAFWLICKDERKRKNDWLGEGVQSAFTGKTYRAFLKRCWSFLKTQRPFLKTSRSFCSTQPDHRFIHTVASAYTYICVSLHVRTHRATLTYVCISLHIYMLWL